MSQPNVKELEALIKMLRKQGVTSFEGHGLRLEIEPADTKPSKGQSSDQPASDESLSDEDALFWSVSGN